MTLVFQAVPWGWTNKHSGLSKPESVRGAYPSFPSEDNHQTWCVVGRVLGDNATVLPAEAAEEAEGAVATARPPPGAPPSCQVLQQDAPHVWHHLLSVVALPLFFQFSNFPYDKSPGLMHFVLCGKWFPLRCRY